MSNLETATQNQKTDVKMRAYHFSIRVIKFMDSLPNKRIFG